MERLFHLKRHHARVSTEVLGGVTTFVTMAYIIVVNPANGVTAGLAVYPLLKVLTGRARELNAGMIVLGALCALYYTFGLIH